MARQNIVELAVQKVRDAGEIEYGDLMASLPTQPTPQHMKLMRQRLQFELRATESGIAHVVRLRGGE